jgi:acetyl-CoA carboxylase biotin carboxyl carrier protein
MAKTPFEPELVRSLALLLDETNLSEIEYEVQGTRIRVVRQITVTAASAFPPAAPVGTLPAAAAPIAEAAADPAKHPGALKSPMVGVAYLAQEPGSPPFVKIGDRVSEGQTLLLIEAMKTYNPIRATKAGTLTALFVEDGQPVEYGEPLAIIE